MKIKLWGTRGSIPSPGKETVKYGGNTTCIQVSLNSGTEIIIDAGTGIRKLGKVLLQNGVKEIHLFITHSHWDHIQGFPFFVPVYIKGFKIHIYGASPTFDRLVRILSGQMKFLYFPVEYHTLNSEIDYRKIKKRGIEIDGVKITAIRTNHPLETHAFKFEEDGKTFVFMTDNELDDREKAVVPYKEHLKFIEGADLLIHDAQYSRAEYENYIGWGHSTWESVVEMADEGDVKRVLLTHHDPERSDEALDKIIKDAKEYAKKTEVDGAMEGMELQL
ncbi:MAG TPA: MBL fold metallo-hydrolase [candidate division WOR-3 bacterium]|uniref:MBL fold metallo-hydrolase n=1 Tax=candidate division WOR-3 bacterium TaxID=2052148 RepID=A0A7C0Z905_UNCW3|nr:MBL fold metallo-hydrolase [candidate division WOR-3 bacterium]